MSKFYKYRTKNEYSVDLNEIFVGTMSGHYPNNSTQEFRLPNWMKEKLQSQGNVSDYLRKLILQDFYEKGIREPLTEEEKQKRILEMQDFQ